MKQREVTTLPSSRSWGDRCNALRHSVTPLTIFAAICCIIVFLSMLVGWRLLPEDVTGLYSITDGNYTRWNYEYVLDWGHWFRLSNFNPFSGLGSDVLDEHPMAQSRRLGPPASALHPDQHHDFLPDASSAVLGQPVLPGIHFRCVTAGNSVLWPRFRRAAFPPFTKYWGTIVHVSIAPFRLVTMAAANFMICSMVIAAHGKQRHAFAIAVAGGVTALIWGVYASATYFVFDLVVVGGFFVILLLGAPHRARLLATVALIAAFFITTGLAGYIEALTSVSMRAQPQLADLVNGLRLLVSDEAVRASFVSTLLVCQGQMSQYVPCISTPSFLLFAFSLAAAVCESALQMRSSERSRSTVFCCSWASDLRAPQSPSACSVIFMRLLYCTLRLRPARS